MRDHRDRIVVIGDMHGRWNSNDNLYFDQNCPDLILFVGDIGGGTLADNLAVVSRLSRMSAAGLLMPGNNDAPYLAQIEAELSHRSGAIEVMRFLGEVRRQGVQPCGFSLHEIRAGKSNVSLIAARPCAMGGSECSFPEVLSRNYGVENMEQSRARLRQLVDEAPHQDLIFLAHNGPWGLGEEPTSLFGRDFSFPDERENKKERDWGDRDLSEAVAYAKAQGKRVLGVIAGHMHRRSQGKSRALSEVHDETVYLNTAIVPRIRSKENQELHHFIELELAPEKDSAAERFSARERWEAMA